MSDILKEIAANKLEEIKASKQKQTLAQLKDAVKAANIKTPVRRFAIALEKKPIAIIAELKKASPSSGLIRENFKPDDLAKDCEDGGAACLSVLTDRDFFQGSDLYLQQASKACTLPVLCKDFFYDIWQVLSARAMGADAILLIMAILSLEQAKELTEMANKLQMDILPEVHNEKELEAALNLNTKLIGINNRDLKTFATDLTVSEKLAPLVPKNRLIVCESGVKTKKDIERMSSSNINSFLIGESLMRQKDVKTAIQNLL